MAWHKLGSESKMVSTWVDEAVRLRLRHVAKRHGIKQSDILRDGLTYMLARLDPQGELPAAAAPSSTVSLSQLT